MSDTQNDHVMPVETATVASGEEAAPTSTEVTIDGDGKGGVAAPSNPAEAGVVKPANPAEAGVVEPDAEDAAAEGPAEEDESDEKQSDEDENPLETEAEIAADYLEELLDIADLDGDIDTYIDGNRAHVSIVSGSETLVGPDGQVLDALQELARLAVMTETGDRSRLMLDVAGYRDRRRQQLITIATDAVEEVKSGSASVALAPMNPFERKIVHDAVAAAGLTSASEGEEPKRRVVVQPAG